MHLFYLHNCILFKRICIRYKFINYLKNFNSINDRDSELLLKNNLNNVDLLKTNDLKDNFKTIKKLENVQELIN